MSILNLSGKVDEKSIAIYSAIDRAAKELGIEYVVVGASARDLVLHYGYGAEIKRRTEDIDYGIQIPDWQTFDALGKKLIEFGFRQTNALHRFIHEALKIDLVPFGGIQNKDAVIAWPPKGEVEMNVLGFHEALKNSVNLIIQDKPKIEVSVVMPPGLSLLKLICWTDRDADLKAKDAKDLLYLFKSYEDIPETREAIYEYTEILEEYDWDITLGSVFKLGVDTQAIATEQTKNYLKSIENNEIDKRNTEQLVEDMCEDIEEEFEFNQKLFNAYFRGLNYK